MYGCKDTGFCLLLSACRSRDPMHELLFYPIFTFVLLLFTWKIKLPWSTSSDPELHADMTDFPYVHNILKTRNPYYLALSHEGKQKFYRRIQAFNSSKEYRGMNGLHVTPEMKTIIAASAAQLTFGLKNFTLGTIRYIEVYPEIFFSRFHKEQLKGITTGTGVLAVSW